MRCLYRRAVDDGLISEADNPARKVAKPRRLPSTRRAVVRELPPGTNLAASGAVLRFRDAAGVIWVRGPDGALTEQQ